MKANNRWYQIQNIIRIIYLYIFQLCTCIMKYMCERGIVTFCARILIKYIIRGKQKKLQVFMLNVSFCQYLSRMNAHRYASSKMCNHVHRVLTVQMADHEDNSSLNEFGRQSGQYSLSLTDLSYFFARPIFMAIIFQLVYIEQATLLNWFGEMRKRKELKRVNEQAHRGNSQQIVHCRVLITLKRNLNCLIGRIDSVIAKLPTLRIFCLFNI